MSKRKIGKSFVIQTIHSKALPVPVGYEVLFDGFWLRTFARQKKAEAYVKDGRAERDAIRLLGSLD